MRYIIFCEDGSIYQTDSITEDDEDAFFSWMVSIVDTKNMTVCCDDMSWKPIQEWG